MKVVYWIYLGAASVFLTTPNLACVEFPKGKGVSSLLLHRIVPSTIQFYYEREVFQTHLEHS